MARPQQLFHFGLNDCWRKWELKPRERGSMRRCPEGGPVLNTEPDSKHISGTCLFFSECLLGSTSPLRGYTHSFGFRGGTGSLALCLHAASGVACFRLTLVSKVPCALPVPYLVITIAPPCAVCFYANVFVSFFFFFKLWKTTLA